MRTILHDRWSILQSPIPIILPMQLVMILMNPTAYQISYNFTAHASTSNTSPGLSLDEELPIFDPSLRGTYLLVRLSSYIYLAGATQSQINSMTGFVFILKNSFDFC